jgi:signal transduction histidine kinase/CheY-like chemotaxis protein
MSSPAPVRQRLRTLLTVPFTALILLPALIIALTSLYTGLKAVDSLSERVITDVSSRVEQAAVHQLEEASITLRSLMPELSDSFDGSIELFTDRKLLERKLFEITAATRTTGYFYFGGEDGSFLGVDRGRPGARAAATVRLGEREGQPRKIYSARTPEDRSRLLEVETRLYDPRTRPWYLKAKANKQLTWTPVYVSFASGSLVTTAAEPVATRDGRMLGVLAADVELAELSAFMKTVSVSENGVAFIVDHEGYLVASSAPGLPFRESGGTQQRVKIEDSANLVERDAAAWWRTMRLKDRDANEQRKHRTELNAAKITGADGDAVDVAMRHVSRVEGVDWDIVVAIPRADLTAPVVRNTLVMFFIIVGALIASLQLGLWIVRRVTSDVDALVKATNIDALAPERFEQPKTTLHETSVLGAAFTAMFARLRDSLTTIRRQNEDLAALNATLEERVERRTRQLESKNFELTAEVARREQLEVDLRAATDATVKQADDKARFMAMLSHELRTPLQAVVSASELLAKKSQSYADEAGILDAASKSILTLVDGVLSYSKLEAGKVTPQRSSFNVRDLVNEAIGLARAAQPAYRPNVTVSIDDLPARIRTDAGMLRQVLVNLVGNAIKHAKDGRIDVRLSRGSSRAEWAQQSPDAFQLRVSVADDGPGIPENARHLLFQPFQQIGRGAADPSQGSGLGLAICALLVRALDGDIRHAARVQPGTEIEFDIRVEDAHATDVAHSNLEAISMQVAKPVAPPRSHSVLLVDDHRVNLRLVSELLNVLGHRTTLADSGEAAIAAVREQIDANLRASTEPNERAMFDAIFMDLNLPGISGIDAVSAIRVLCRERSIPAPIFIALTASTSEEDLQRCAAVGMNLRVTKPATVASLQSVLSRAFEVSQDAPPFGAGAANATLDSAIDETQLEQLREVERRGQQPFVVQLVEDFLGGLDNEFADIVEAIREEERILAQQRAHALAGAAASVGARELAMALRPPAFEARPTYLALLEPCVKRTRIALQNWLTNQ